MSVITVQFQASLCRAQRHTTLQHRATDIQTAYRGLTDSNIVDCSPNLQASNMKTKFRSLRNIQHIKTKSLYKNLFCLRGTIQTWTMAFLRFLILTIFLRTFFVMSWYKSSKFSGSQVPFINSSESPEKNCD